MKSCKKLINLQSICRKHVKPVRRFLKVKF